MKHLVFFALLGGACTRTETVGIQAMSGGTVRFTTQVDGTDEVNEFPGGTITAEALQAFYDDGDGLDACGGGPFVVGDYQEPSPWWLYLPPAQSQAWLGDVVGDTDWAPSGDGCRDGLVFFVAGDRLWISHENWHFEPSMEPAVGVPHGRGLAPVGGFVSDQDAVTSTTFTGVMYWVEPGPMLDEEAAARDAVRTPLQIELQLDASSLETATEQVEVNSGPGLGFDFG